MTDLWCLERSDDRRYTKLPPELWECSPLLGVPVPLLATADSCLSTSLCFASDIEGKVNRALVCVRHCA